MIFWFDKTLMLGLFQRARRESTGPSRPIGREPEDDILEVNLQKRRDVNTDHVVEPVQPVTTKKCDVLFLSALET